METKNRISCLIVDDEPMALALIESYVVKTPFLELKGKFTNVPEVLGILSEEQIDLIFLDIQMPEINGIELSRLISKSTRVIFTTAFDKYAIDGFRVDALDYLLKPFNYQEFLAASNKALEWFSLVRSTEHVAGQTETGKVLFVKSDYKQLKINLEEVLYFEGWKDYVKIWMLGKTKPILTLMSLKTLEDELPADRFMRVHRSFIIALHHIEAVERSQVLIGTERITVAEQYKKKFQRFISDNSPEG